MTKVLFYTGTLTAIFAASLPCFAQSLPQLRQGMTYSAARTILIESGWQAVFNAQLVNTPSMSGVVNYFFKEKQYTEIVDCAGTGMGLCLFEFKNAKGKKLFVITANNGPERESEVFGWRLE